MRAGAFCAPRNVFAYYGDVTLHGIRTNYTLYYARNVVRGTHDWHIHRAGAETSTAWFPFECVVRVCVRVRLACFRANNRDCTHTQRGVGNTPYGFRNPSYARIVIIMRVLFVLIITDHECQRHAPSAHKPTYEPKNTHTHTRTCAYLGTTVTCAVLRGHSAKWTDEYAKIIHACAVELSKFI